MYLNLDTDKKKYDYGYGDKTGQTPFRTNYYIFHKYSTIIYVIGTE